MKKAFLFILSFLVITANINAQVNCNAVAPTVAPQQQIPLVCPGNTSQTPTIVNPGTVLPNLEYIIVNQSNQYGGSPAIVGTSADGNVDFSTLTGVQTGDRICLVPVRYDLPQLSSLIDDLLTGTTGIVTCCQIVSAQLPNFCDNLNAVGLYSGADVTGLDDAIALVNVFDPGTQTIPNFIATINTVNSYGGILPTECGSGYMPICYAVDTAQRFCYDYGIRLDFETEPVSTVGGSDGIAVVIPITGVPPYNFLWQNNSTNDTITGLATGTYSVTVTDADGCTGQGSVFVPDICTSINSGAYTSNVTCNGANNGFMFIQPTGGLQPYIISWFGGTDVDTLTENQSGYKTNLGPGSYQFTLTDANGCLVQYSEQIAQPTAVVVTATVNTQNINATTNDVFTGNVTSTTGGTGSYFYNWNFGDGAFDNGMQVSHYYQQAGIYTARVVATDQSACKDTVQWQVTVTGTTALAENDKPAFKIYPNPVNDRLWVTLPENSAVTIIDFSGRVVLSTQVKGNSIATQNLAPGLYLLRFKENSFSFVKE